MTRSIWAAAALLLAPVALLQSGCSFDGHCINCGVADDAGFDGGVQFDSGEAPLFDSAPAPDACINSGVEVCDDLDNDCDGSTDEDIAEVGNPCGTDVGECVAGTLACIDGTMECANGYVPPAPEICDSLDNDCDGTDDNGDPGSGVICGTDTGECRSGLTSCVGGVIECTGMTIDPVAELCDGKDNDCDGMFDEDTPAVPMACGTTDVGECVLGMDQCIGGVIQCVGNVEPVLDVCDGLDNDCDGPSDEDFDFMTDPTHCGDCTTVCDVPDAIETCTGGMCAILACLPGFVDLDTTYSTGCEYACNFQGAEVCGDPDGDGNPDEDCDGIVDEGIVAPDICDQDGSCMGTVATCETAGWRCIYLPPVETDAMGNILPETLCDSFDNDCDGFIDEAYPTLGNPCADGGVGICAGTGTIQCTAPTMATCVIDTPGMPPLPGELCNGLDDDCNGNTDEGDLNDWAAFDNGGTTFYMFQYEASRADADDTSPGVLDTRPCSKPDAIPWTNINYVDANQECIDLGLRICTEAEWQSACEANTGGVVMPYPQDPGPGNIVVFEAENFTANISGTTDDWDTDTAVAGFSGTSAMFANPNDGNNNNTGYEANSPRLDYDVDFVATGTHYVWVLGHAESSAGSNDSCHAGLDGVGFSTSDRMDGWGSTGWIWSNDTMDGVPSTFDVATTGVHTVNIWMREDGLRVDRILLTTDPTFVPTGTGGSGCTWSYDTLCSVYQPDKCNGNDYDCDPVAPGDQDCLLPTADRAMCYADWTGTDLIYDMSGNVKEWTEARSPGVNPLRGGSYNNTAAGISCSFDFAVADDTFQFPNVGFRCCSDTLP